MARQFICNADYPVVQTDAGKLRGFLLDGIFTFHGIKYADAKRFQMPTPVAPWEGIKDATNYGYCCPTDGNPMPTGEQYIPHRFWPENEHCQYLNIWTKSIERGIKKPVIVWFHGGGFANGSSIEQVAYEGDALAAYGDVVVVTVNHRLNILGCLDLSAFGEKYENSQNAGMADLVAALQWIHNNIEGFGGDPENVTIFGQSGGGGKVSNLLQIPAAAGLFHKAIMMSGGAGMAREPQDHKPFVEGILNELNIPVEEVEKLEKVPYAVFMKAYNRTAIKLQKAIMWGPKANGWYLGNPLQVGFSDHAKLIPTMAGTVFAEMSANADPFPAGSCPTEEEQIAKIKEVYGDGADEVIALFKKAYPCKDLRRVPQTDVRMRPGVIKYMEARSQIDTAPVYSYMFALDFDVNSGRAAWHCADIPFVFHNTYRVGNCNIEGVTERLEDELAGAWVAFAYTGNPNHSGMNKWEPYTPDGKATMVFDRKSECKKDFDRELTDALLKYGPAPAGFGPRLPKLDDEENGRDWMY